MIYIACAIYMEAAPFIRRLDCKKDPSFTREQVFVGEDAVIIVTGTSPVPAAAALTDVLAQLPPQDCDIFANIGMCGCSDPAVAPGTLYLIHSITEFATGRRFFPDLLYLHEHLQGALTTYSVVMDGTTDAFLYDCEAAALYQAALPFFSTDRMYYFKVVSDHGDDAGEISPTDAYEFLSGHAASVIESLRRFASYVPRRFAYSEAEEAVIDYFCRSLRCSVTMEHELRRLILYYELERGYAIAHLRDFFPLYGLNYEDDIILGSRREGKDVLDAFRLSCLC